MLPATELATLAAVATAALDQTATILRASRASDGAGGTSETMTPLTTTPAGLSQPSATLLQNYAYLIGSQDSWQVRVPLGTDVRKDDQLQIGDRTLRVQVVLAPRSYASVLTLLAAAL